MATHNTLRLESVTTADIPHITELWYAAFGTSEMLRLFPDTPGLRQWWHDAHRHDLLHNPAQRYVKAVDETGKMVAFAKWDLAVEERGERFPPWHAGPDRLACEEFYGALDRERIKMLRGRRCYYLDMLGTHPDYRRRGAGSMLVRWGCELADRDGLVAYVDASPEGAALYRKFGFEDRTEAAMRERGVTTMVREADGSKL